jgi:DNA adenine methylase
MSPAHNMDRSIKAPFSKGASLVRWAGSKNYITPILIGHLPKSICTYWEPFAGSASLLFALRPTSSVLADINEDLVTFYQQLKLHPQKLHNQVSSLSVDEATYYSLRAIDPINLEPLERATRFIYLNRLCFNGVYRTNRKGLFNVPMGRRTGPFPTALEFMRYSELLASTRIQCESYQQTVSEAKRGDFVYLDPPYKHKPRLSKGEFTYESFDTWDLPELVETAQKLSRRKVKVMLSYIDGPCIRKGLSDWDFHHVDLIPRISRSPSYYSTRELIIKNY